MNKIRSVHSSMSNIRSPDGASIDSYHLYARRFGNSMEACQVYDILRMKAVCLTGGRDRRGGPILLFPSDSRYAELTARDLSTCLVYLGSIPSEESVKKGFTVLVDNRKGTFDGDLNTLAANVTRALSGAVHAICVVQSNKPKSVSELNQSQFQYVSPLALSNICEEGELSADLGGRLLYTHDQWIANRITLERFLKDVDVASRDLDDFYVQTADQMNQTIVSSSQLDLRFQQQALSHQAISTAEKLAFQGRDFHKKLNADAESALPGNRSLHFTMDQVIATNCVKRAVELIESKIDRVKNLFQDRNKETGRGTQLQDLEQAIKTVVDWILGPGEKLLGSRTEIGNNYRAADDLRKQHEQLELKCADSYSMYAELRHRVSETMSASTAKISDLEAQRDYMDMVCRSFASRLEQRRNLVITSVRFHRLVEELTHELDDFLQLLFTEVVADDAASAKNQLKNLETKWDELNSKAELALFEGQNLLNQLCLPVKNAFGQDVSPDRKQQLYDVEKLIEDIQDRRLRCQDLTDVRKLKLQQILQLRTCEQDAEQAIQWIVELCDITNKAATVSVTRNTQELEAYEKEKSHVENTAQNTYEYGKQLLQAALVLRRSLRYDLQPNHDQGRRLADAWKSFSRGINERISRQSTVSAFTKKANSLLSRADELLVVISQSANNELTSEQLVLHYSPSKTQMEREHEDLQMTGASLVDRLQQPILLEEGMEKRMKLDDDGVIDSVKFKIKEMDETLAKLSSAWDQQTRGLHLDSSGQIVGPDGKRWYPVNRSVARYSVSSPRDVNGRILSSTVLGPSVSVSRSQAEPSDPWKKAEKEIEDVNYWIRDTGMAALEREPDMGITLTSANEFLESHRKLDDALKRKQPDVDEIVSLHERLVHTGYPDAVAAGPRVKVFREQWDLLKIYVQERIVLALSYVDFHKVTQKLMIHMDVLEESLKSSPVDSGQLRLSETEVQVKTQDYKRMTSEYSEAKGKGRKFISNVADVKVDKYLDKRRALSQVEYHLGHMEGRRRHLNNLFERWNSGFQVEDDYQTFVKSAKELHWDMDELSRHIDNGARPPSSRYVAESSASAIEEKIGDLDKIAVSLVERGHPEFQKIESDMDEIRRRFSMLRDNIRQKDPVLLTFQEPLADGEVTRGQSFLFRCRPAAGAHIYSVDWLKDGAPVVGRNYRPSIENGVCFLTVDDARPEDSGIFSCRVETDAGVAESTARLEVKENRPRPVAPSFTKALHPIDVHEGATLNLECEVTGYPDPAVTWTKDEFPVRSSTECVIIAHENSHSLLMQRVQRKHSGRYVCRAQNTAGHEYTSAYVNVVATRSYSLGITSLEVRGQPRGNAQQSLEMPQFTELLKSATVLEASNVALRCSFTGEPKPRIRWMKDEMDIRPNATFKIQVEQNFSVLEIQEAVMDHTGVYTVVASNPGGEQRSSCHLTVMPAKSSGNLARKDGLSGD